MRSQWHIPGDPGAEMAEKSDILDPAPEAGKYATCRGRLHLKWGEALGYAGKADEAKK